MSEKSPQSDQNPSGQMFQDIISPMIPQAVHVAAKIELADMVAKTPTTVEELAATKGSNAPSLRRLLKFLTSPVFSRRMGQGNFTQPCSAIRSAETIHNPHEVRYPVVFRIAVKVVLGACRHRCYGSAGVQLCI